MNWARRRGIQPSRSRIHSGRLDLDPDARRVDAERLGIDSFSCRIDVARAGIHAPRCGIDAFRGRIELARADIKSEIARVDGLCMATVPKRLSDKVAFYQTHLTAFTANRSALGLTPEEVADLQTRTDGARAAFLAQQDAILAARSATLTYNLAVAAMADVGAAILEKIRANARSSHDPSLYTLASIPLPAPQTPIDAPGTPDRLITTLLPDGSLRLKWTCPNPRGSTGTVYQIYRSVANEPPVYLACVGTKSYVDETIPKGATTLLYKIQAVRSTRVGNTAMFNVNFGSNGAKPLPKNQYTPRHAIATSLAA